jgi:hypothetical protein
MICYARHPEFDAIEREARRLRARTMRNGLRRIATAFRGLLGRPHPANARRAA